MNFLLNIKEANDCTIICFAFSFSTTFFLGSIHDSGIRVVLFFVDETTNCRFFNIIRLHLLLGSRWQLHLPGCHELKDLVVDDKSSKKVHCDLGFLMQIVSNW